VDPSNAPWRVLEPAEADPEPSAEPRHPPVRWVAVAAGGAVIALAVAAFLLASQPAPAVSVDGATAYGSASADPGTAPAASPGAKSGIVVEVAGAVVRPGVYHLPAGSRVGDAITAAGGYTSRVDAAAVDAQLNLASVLGDADKVRVPARGDPTPPPSSAAGDGNGSVAAASGPLDLNTATATQLDALPGIGPVTAAKIISAREQQRFASVDDLVARKVLGSATLEKIRALVTVSR
jgi:competence protein ComEA